MNKEQTISPLAIALGFFDGVHKGHAALLKKVAEHPAKSAVFTLDRHPSSLIGQQAVPLLTSVADRSWLMEEYFHIEQVIVSDFSAIHAMDWQVFIQDYLQKSLHVTHVVAGHDFRFGRGGEGNPQKLQEHCAQLGMTCEIVAPVSYEGVLVSSTHIRQLIASSSMKEATDFLGHPHILSQTVVHGNKIGTNTLGFPTVNLSIPPEVIIPAFGVYACHVWVGQERFQAVTNVGIRPTVAESQEKQVTVEAYLLDFPPQTLYGHTLRVAFYHHLRGERKFQDFKALSTQIALDVESTRDFFRSFTEKNQ